MVALGIRRHRFAVYFGAVLALFLASPGQIAPQDLASLLTYRPLPIERGAGFLLSFSALRTATFSLPRPALFALPELPEPIRVAVRADRDSDLDITGSIPGNASVTGVSSEYEEPQTTVINRAGKGNRLAINVAAVPTRTVTSVDATGTDAAVSSSQHDVAMAVEIHPTVPNEEDEPRADRAGSLVRAVGLPPAGSFGIYRFTRLFFGDDPTGMPPLTFQHRDVALVSLPGTAPTEGSTTIAAKGEVTGEEARPKSPAERLGLKGPALVKAEKCLADAIYFESRGEVKEGQTAVAQVVVNRAFSGFYPNDICNVVYQNANRYLACQFTFACEGKRLKVDEPDMWEQAKEISHDMLDGKLWLDQVGKATHYHAYWVHPDWIREMRKIHRIGVHTFYRPKAWEG
jgi:spore germination cell wall hydrolase CwlJ-like protein